MNRTLGIDVGIAITGWSIVEGSSVKSARDKNKIIAYGTVETQAGLHTEERLSQLYDDLIEIIEEFKPKFLAIESIFYFKNQKTIIDVSQARGVILLAASKKGLSVSHYTPLQVKMSVAGYGRAEKKQVQEMVKMIYKLKVIPKPDDIADAIAVATCHLNSYKFSKLTSKKL